VAVAGFSASVAIGAVGSSAAGGDGGNAAGGDGGNAAAARASCRSKNSYVMSE